MITFGPVTSRRLGLSLGINNIVTKKLCTYNCVYCQVGKTESHATSRHQQYEPGVLAEQVKQHLQKLDLQHKPDYLTFVANGEPTLDINLSEEIQMLREVQIPIAIITNVSLISDDAVCEALSLADWLSVKVDSVDDAVWRKINRPEGSIDLYKNLNSIKQFRKTFAGKFHTETMLVKDYNENTGSITQIAEFVSELNPDRAFLSIPTRPPAVGGIGPVSEEKLTEAWNIFQSNGITTELLAGFEGTDTGYTGNVYEDILNISAVHPIREDTMAELLLKNKADARVIQTLIHQNLIKRENYNGKDFYIRKYNSC